MRRRSSSQAAETLTPAQMPRDVEAVEAVIDQLDRGISGESHGHLVISETLVRELQLGYCAVWLPGTDGAFRLHGQYGPLAGAIAAGAGGQVTRMTSADGYGGEAI